MLWKALEIFDLILCSFLLDDPVLFQLFKIHWSCKLSYQLDCLSTIIFEKSDGSTTAQTATVKGAIVIRMAQESDFPSLATVPLPQAIQTALAQLPGGLLKAETEEENGALVHHIEIVGTDKTITEFTIDAGTGTVLARSVDKADNDKREESKDDEDDD